MAEQVPLLSAEDAETLAQITDGMYAMLRNDKHAPEFSIPKLKAIASGSAVVVPAITRESLRAELRKLIGDGRCLFDAQRIVHFKEHDIVDVLRKLGIEVKE